MSREGPAPGDCRREIEQLHDFFVGWYADERDDFDRMERVIAPGFEMVTPDGDRLDRDSVLGMVRDGRGKHDPGAFDIEIRNVAVRDSGTGHALVRYEEWQTAPDGEDGRVSTVLFRTDSDAPNGLVWVAVHETWLESD